MESFKSFLSEENEFSHKRAEREFNRVKSLAGTVGAYSGGARVVYSHKGGQLSRTMVMDHNTGYTEKRGHHFAQHYSSRPGHNAYTHVHFKGEVPKSMKELKTEIDRQNPHNKGTGHSHNLAGDIITHYHKEDWLKNP